MRSRKKRFPLFSLLPILIIAVSLPLFVIAIATNKDVRSRAAGFIVTTLPANTASLYNGFYWCHGCSASYNHAYARWKSTTSDCAGIVGTPEYTPSCGCSASGPLPSSSGFTSAMCDSPGPYVCSGCAGEQNIAGLRGVGDIGFVTWWSSYSDCTQVLRAGSNASTEPQFNLQDPYCNPFSRENIASPTPASNEPSCTLTAKNNPCPLYPGQTRCEVTVEWTYNVPDSRYEMHEILIPLSGLQGGEGQLHDDSNVVGKHYGSVPLTKGWQETALLEGKIDGVTKCQLSLSFVEVNQQFTYPTNINPDCQRDAGGNPVCQVNPAFCRAINSGGGCGNDEVLCEAEIDACGCANRLGCAKKSAGSCEAQRDQFGPWRKAADGYQRQCGDKKRTPPTPTQTHTSRYLYNQFSTFFQNLLPRNR